MNIHDATRVALSDLTPCEAKLLRMRFGIDTNTAQTLEEIAKDLGIETDRVRELVGVALCKLRHPCQDCQGDEI